MLCRAQHGDPNTGTERRALAGQPRVSRRGRACTRLTSARMSSGALGDGLSSPTATGHGPDTGGESVCWDEGGSGRWPVAGDHRKDGLDGAEGAGRAPRAGGRGVEGRGGSELRRAASHLCRKGCDSPATTAAPHAQPAGDRKQGVSLGRVQQNRGRGAHGPLWACPAHAPARAPGTGACVHLRGDPAALQVTQRRSG